MSGHNPEIMAVVDRVAAAIVMGQKYRCPVSPVCAESDRPSGWLRSSVRAVRQPDGDVLVGAWADYAIYVEEDTLPHVIESHGPWPLRSRCPPAVFGRKVLHPGTKGKHFVRDSVADANGLVFHIG